MLSSPQKTNATKLILSNNEILSMSRWLKKHSKICTNLEKGELLLALDQQSSSGLGLATVVRCSCGEEFDITDYGVW